MGCNGFLQFRRGRARMNNVGPALRAVPYIERAAHLEEFSDMVEDMYPIRRQHPFREKQNHDR